MFSVDKNFLNENISSRVRGGREKGKEKTKKTLCGENLDVETLLGTLFISCSPHNKEERAMTEQSGALTSEG